MTRQLARAEPLHARFADAFVILSVTLLSLASGAWLIARLGFELWPAMLAALAIYCALLLVHLLVRRSFTAGYDEEDDLESDVHWQSAAERFDAALADYAADDAPDPQEATEPLRPRMRAGSWPTPLPMPESAEAPAAPPPAATDPFKFRPARQPYFEDDGEPLQPGETQAIGNRAHEPPAGQRQPQAPAEPPEMNVELIQDLIKKLADELNSTAAHDSDAERGPGPEPASAREAMIGRSAAALDTTARTMRAAASGAAPSPAAREAAKVPDKASGRRPGGPATPQRGGPPALDPKLARIAEAIAAERIEVLLDPIHVLAEGRPRHYEVSMRLLTADGTALEQPEFTRMAVGSGLMPRIDAARMLRAARIARRLGERGRQGSVLAATAGESLTDEKFLDAAALQPGTDGRIGLVLSFTQSDVRTFTPVHAEAVGTMAAAGFGFALEEVTDLNMDFGGLKAMGFEFVKLDAQVFLEGLPAPEGRIPAADICRYLSDFGLTLIVGRIEDDWLLARILGFGVLLGKGALFGGPKLVKAEVVAEPGSAAA